MGNSSSTNVFLSVNDSRTCITAGSTLSGEIRCPDHTVSNDIFTGVTLYFIGREDVEVQYTESSHGTKGGGAKFKAATRDIVRTIISLDTSRTSVEAGRYPFQFRIPDQLPSSMYYKDGNGGYCAIRYKIKLQLLRGRDQEIPLEIVAKPPAFGASPVPSVPDPAPARIAFLCCVPRGSITWAAGAENTRVGAGEEVVVRLGARNESRARLERVTAKLKQTVEWHSAGHSSVNKSVLRSESFDLTESMTTAAGPREEKDGRLDRGGGGGTARRRQPLTAYEDVLRAAHEGDNRVTFRIPDYVPQSYVGRLIKIQYYVSITAKTPSCFTSPKIHIPIEIVSPKDTPPIVAAARAIPMPSAPPSPSYDEFWEGTCDAGATRFSDAFLVSAVAVDGEGEEERLLGPAGINKASTMRTDGYAEGRSSEPPRPRSGTSTTSATDEAAPPPPFDAILVEPEPSGSARRERASTH